MGKETKINNLSKSGFTLVELLIVISIIGLLASVILLAFGTVRVKSRDAKRIADMQQIAKSMELFYSYCNSYPQLPPATTNVRLNNTLALYTGTAAACGSNPNGVLPNGGFGATHVAGAGETIFVALLPTAPAQIDDGTLAVGSKCSEANTATSSQKWGEYNYVSFGPNQFWLYFCFANPQGNLAPGRWILTERGITQFTGNYYP